MLHALGVDPGPAGSLITADEFNQDGYWEQRPVVQLNDDLLRAQRGFASAPPRREHSWAVGPQSQQISALLSMFERPWFVKDPRMCLLLTPWQHAAGADGFPVVVTRDPRRVAASLHRRNGYGLEMGAALWERYTHDLLTALSGRASLSIRYERLVATPDRVIQELGAVAADHVGDQSFRGRPRLAEAVGLVRPRAEVGDHERIDVPLTESQNELYEIVTSLEGRRDAYTLPRLPAPSGRSQQILERRRRMLLVIDRPLRSNAGLRALGDRRALSH
ncbi:MAG: hypothetical protein ABI807_12540 [Sporichthyaceae bacterium]